MELIFVDATRKGPNFVLSFAIGYLVVPAPFVKKTVLFPLNYLDTLVENQLTISVRVYFGLSVLFH